MRALMLLPATHKPLADDAKPAVPETLSTLPSARPTVPDAAARSVVSALSKE